MGHPDTPRAEPWSEIDWLAVCLLAVFIAACIIAAPLLMEWTHSLQPRPAECAHLSGAECWALAQEGGL